MSVEKIVIHPSAASQFRMGMAHGLGNFMFAWEGGAKRNSPVRGGHRSFSPGGPVGGTLRRSLHAAVYVNGNRVIGGADENGASIPAYSTDGVAGVIGTNCGYGEWVHDGTYKMPARPFIAEALQELRDQAQSLIVAGAMRFLGAR